MDCTQCAHLSVCKYRERLAEAFKYLPTKDFNKGWDWLNNFGYQCTVYKHAYSLNKDKT